MHSAVDKFVQNRTVTLNTLYVYNRRDGVQHCFDFLSCVLELEHFLLQSSYFLYIDSTFCTTSRSKVEKFL